MLWLRLLPNELLIEILHCLPDDDIDTVRLMDEFKDRMKKWFHFVFPQKKKVHGHFSRVTGDTFFVFVETWDPGHTKMRRKLATWRKSHLDIRLKIIARDLITIANIEKFSFARQDLGFLIDLRFNSITFKHVTRLVFYDVTVDPKVFHFPRVKELVFDHCEAPLGTPHKFYFPHLKRLDISTTFSTIDRCLDYAKLRVETLRLLDILDMEVWENITFPSLKTLEISRTVNYGHMKEIKNCSFKSLLLFDSSRAGTIEFFSNINCPNLQQWQSGGSVTKYERTFSTYISPKVIIERLVAPLMTELTVCSGETVDFRGVSFPALKKASIAVELGMYEDEVKFLDFSCLNLPIELYVESCESLLSQTPKIVSLHLGDDLPEKKYHLPDLKCLVLDNLLELKKDLGKVFYTENITEVILLLESELTPEEEEMVRKQFPNLKNLAVDI